MKDKIAGALYGMALGDAMGMPAELWGRNRARKFFHGKITELSEIICIKSSACCRGFFKLACVLVKDQSIIDHKKQIKEIYHGGKNIQI